MGMGDDIFIVRREKLFDSDGSFQGFVAREQRDFVSRISKHGEYLTRTPELEKDSGIQQVIPYVWLVNPDSRKAFLYKRAGTGNEARLHHKFSGGVGGHIDRKSIAAGEDPIESAMMRELQEETVMCAYPKPRIVGFIKDDADEVGSVHFGVVAIGETTEEVRPAEDMADGRFYSSSEIDALFNNTENNVEGWTRISWQFIKDFLSRS